MDGPGPPTGCALRERYAFVRGERATGKTWRRIGEQLGISASRAAQLAKEAADGLRRTFDTADDLADYHRRLARYYDTPQDAAELRRWVAQRCADLGVEDRFASPRHTD